MPSILQTGYVVLLAVAALPACAQPSEARMDVVHGKPYVMVMVNGKGPFRFVLDTGTGAQALVTADLANQLQMPVVGQARLTDPSGQGKQRSPVVQVDSLSVAGIEFTQVHAVLHSLAAEDINCQGLLGFALFRDYLLTLDYPGQKMMLAFGALKPDGGRKVLPMRIEDGLPIFTLTLGEQRLDAELDSGGIGLSLPEHLAQRLKFDADPEAFANSESLTTRFQIKAGKLGSDVQVGRYTFVHPFVEINPAFPLVNFGASAMQNFVITFDQVNLLVRLDAREKLLHLSPLPTLMRLQNAPPVKPADPTLVPVG